MRRDHDKQLGKLENLHHAEMEMLELQRRRKLWDELAKRNGIPYKSQKLRMAEAEVAELRNLHDAGKEMLRMPQSWPESMRRDSEYLIKCIYFFERRFFGRVESLLAIAPEFAKKYTAAELDVLCTLRRPDGSPLQVDHLELLLSLPCKTDVDRCQRSELQKEVAEKSCTPAELADKIKERFPKSRRQNRPAKGCGNPAKQM